MQYTQLLSIELTTECNLGTLHYECPNRSPERYRYLNTSKVLTDGVIRGVVKRMYREFGFRGLVAWHYYCEPLLEQERMFCLMSAIKAETPEARFLLWTNGTLLPADLRPFGAFDRIVVTDYGNAHKDRVAELARVHNRCTVHSWPLDERLEIEGPEKLTPCGRMFTEFIIDAFGNVHLCCFDWKGHGSPGNVHTHPLEIIVNRWQAIRLRMVGPEMADSSPAVCKRCQKKHPGVAPMLHPIIAVPEVVDSAKRYIHERDPVQYADLEPKKERSSKPAKVYREHDVLRIPKGRKIAVVFVAHTKVPAARIRDHFRWNGKTYRKSGVQVYMVTEKIHYLPRYAECVIFPKERLPIVDGEYVFSLCATKNAGLQKALDDGADVVICTDVDMVFPGACWNEMVFVDDSKASVPVYGMIHDNGEKPYWIDEGCGGTISMTAENWRRIKWDERCKAYGGDDGIIRTDIKNAGIKEVRECLVYHVDHPGESAAINKPGHGRDGAYGRDDGFNFDNFAENRKLLNERMIR